MTKSHSAALIAVLSGIWAEIATHEKHMLSSLLAAMLMVVFFFSAISHSQEEKKKE